MKNKQWSLLAALVVTAAACAHDGRDSETPAQMTPASGYNPETPLPSTTNEPAQPGSPEPMNKPQAVPPPGQDAPAPDSRLDPHPSEPSSSPLGAP